MRRCSPVTPRQALLLETTSEGVSAGVKAIFTARRLALAAEFLLGNTGDQGHSQNHPLRTPAPLCPSGSYCEWSVCSVVGMPCPARYHAAKLTGTNGSAGSDHRREASEGRPPAIARVTARKKRLKFSGATANEGFDIDEAKSRIVVPAVAVAAIGADLKLGRATP